MRRLKVPRASFGIPMLRDADYMALTAGPDGLQALGVFLAVVLCARERLQEGRTTRIGNWALQFMDRLRIVATLCSLTPEQIQTAVDTIEAVCSENGSEPWLSLQDDRLTIRSFFKFNTKEGWGGKRDDAGRKPPRKNQRGIKSDSSCNQDAIKLDSSVNHLDSHPSPLPLPSPIPTPSPVPGWMERDDGDCHKDHAAFVAAMPTQREWVWSKPYHLNGLKASWFELAPRESRARAIEIAKVLKTELPKLPPADRRFIDGIPKLLGDPGDPGTMADPATLRGMIRDRLNPDGNAASPLAHMAHTLEYDD